MNFHQRKYNDLAFVQRPEHLKLLYPLFEAVNLIPHVQVDNVLLSAGAILDKSRSSYWSSNHD